MKKELFILVIVFNPFSVLANDENKSLCNKYADEIYTDQSKTTIDNVRKYCKALAESGDAEAQYNYASIFSFKNSAYDRTEYEKWMLLAAKNGFAKAQYFMAAGYIRGSPDEVIQAIKWYKNASRNGVTLASMQLGFIYQDGIGVPVDGKKAVYWYEYAVEKYRFYGAMKRLVKIYTHGIQGVAANKEKAEYWRARLEE